MSDEQMFRVGDVVTWDSQAGGYYKSKTGKVRFVVPKDVHPRVLLSNTEFSGDFGNLPRNHTTYLVQIGRAVTLLWPRVSHLRKVLNSEVSK